MLVYMTLLESKYFSFSLLAEHNLQNDIVLKADYGDDRFCYCKTGYEFLSPLIYPPAQQSWKDVY